MLVTATLMSSEPAEGCGANVQSIEMCILDSAMYDSQFSTRCDRYLRAGLRLLQLNEAAMRFGGEKRFEFLGNRTPQMSLSSSVFPLHSQAGLVRRSVPVVFPTGENSMSHRRKHVTASSQQDIQPPGEGQQIVRALGSRGGNIVEVGLGRNNPKSQQVAS